VTQAIRKLKVRVLMISKFRLLSLVFSLLFLAVGLGVWATRKEPAKFVFAGDSSDLKVNFANAPLFDQHNMLPGDQLMGRWFEVENTSNDTTFPLYLVAWRTGGDSGLFDLADVINIKVTRENGNVIYDDTLKRLFDKSKDKSSRDDLDEDDGIFLDTDLDPGGKEKFFISVKFNGAAGNDYQGKEVIWDALLGFVGGAPQGKVLAATTGGQVLGAFLPMTGRSSLAFGLLGLLLLGSGLIIRTRGSSARRVSK